MRAFVTGYCCNSPVTVCSIPLLWTLGGTLMIQTSFINVFLFICFFSTQLSVPLIFLCNYIVFVIWRHFKLYLSIRLLDLSLSRRPSPFIFAFASGYSNGEIVSARDSLHSPPQREAWCHDKHIVGTCHAHGSVFASRPTF